MTICKVPRGLCSIRSSMESASRGSGWPAVMDSPAGRAFWPPVETEAVRDVVKITSWSTRPERSIVAVSEWPTIRKFLRCCGMAIFEAGKSQILFGLRHSPPGGDRFLSAAIDQSRVVRPSCSMPSKWRRRGGSAERRRHRSCKDHCRVAARPGATPSRTAVRAVSGATGEAAAGRGPHLRGPAGKRPEPTHLLARGNPGQKQELVGPGGIRSLSGLSADLGIAVDAPDGVRRQAARQNGSPTSTIRSLPA